MDYLKRRQKNRQRLYSKITIAGLALLLLLLVKPTWNIFQKSVESKRNLRNAERELAELEQRKTELESDIAYLKSEHGRDQEIRDKFGLAKEGETMVVIVRSEEKPALAPEPEKPSLLRRAWSGFLSIFGLE
jgi:cell division protein FtsB